MRVVTKIMPKIFECVAPVWEQDGFANVNDFRRVCLCRKVQRTLEKKRADLEQSALDKPCEICLDAVVNHFYSAEGFKVAEIEEGG